VWRKKKPFEFDINGFWLNNETLIIHTEFLHSDRQEIHWQMFICGMFEFRLKRRFIAQKNWVINIGSFQLFRDAFVSLLWMILLHTMTAYVTVKNIFARFHSESRTKTCCRWFNRKVDFYSEFLIFFLLAQEFRCMILESCGTHYFTEFVTNLRKINEFLHSLRKAATKLEIKQKRRESL
jgi:hypothetical protein